MDGKIILTEGNNLERFNMRLKALADNYDSLTQYQREFVDNMQECIKDDSWNPTTKQWNFLSTAWLDMVNSR